MATARPGWSRRAQYGLFFSFLAVMAGIVIGVILLAMSLVAPQQYQRVRGAALLNVSSKGFAGLFIYSWISGPRRRPSRWGAHHQTRDVSRG